MQLAIEKNEIEKIRKLLENGENTNSFSIHGGHLTPFHYALKKRSDLEIIKLFLKYGADINLGGGIFPSSPLHIACQNQPSLEVIKFLIEKGAKINSKGGFNEKTPLHNACKKNASAEIIRYLISKGANTNAQDTDDATPLHYAAQSKAPLVIFQILLKSGADPNIPRSDRRIPLFLALKNQLELPIIEELLNSHSDVNFLDKKKYTPFIFAFSRLCDEQVCHLLLYHKANPNISNRKGRTPLYFAIKQKYSTEIIQSLLKSKADPNSVDNNGYTPLHKACLNSSSPEIVRMLIIAGSKIDAIDRKKNTPLHLCCISNPNEEVVRLLLDSNADLNALNEDNKKPIQLLQRSETNIKMLIGTYETFGEDFEQLLERQNFFDFEIEAKDGKIGVNQEFVKARIGIENLNKKLIWKSNTKKEVFDFMRFLYSGKMREKTVLEKISGQLQLKEWEKKAGKIKLVEDLRKLYEDDISKDFTIICFGQEIKVHKFVLCARSDLYYGMFTSINDSSNRVKDYSGKSPETFRSLVRFIYLDQIQEPISQKIFLELQDAHDYYQLNENTSLKYNLFKVFARSQKLN